MAVTDYFSGAADQLDAPGSSAFAIAPSDTVPLPSVTRGIWVGGAGNVSVVMRDGSTVVFVGVAVGTLLPLRVQQINATGTTATNMVGIH